MTLKKVIERDRCFVEDFDWLAVAIGHVGGIRPAAKLLGKSPITIRKWLAKGLLDTRLEDLLLLAKKGHVEIEHLIERVGPPTPAMLRARAMAMARSPLQISAKVPPLP